MSTQPDELTTAEREHEQARAALEAVQARVLDGDPSITASELIKAEAVEIEKRTLLDKVRQVVASQRAAAAERKRLERIAKFDALITERFGEHQGDVLEAYDDVVAAVGKLIDLGVEHNAGYLEILGKLGQLEPLPSHLVANSAVGQMHVNGNVVDQIKLDLLVQEAAWTAFDTRSDRPVRDLARIFHVSGGGPAERLRRTAKAVAERHDAVEVAA